MPQHTASYLWPAVLDAMKERDHCRVLDIGCGDGSFVNRLATLGYDAYGIDPSAKPGGKVSALSGYDDIAATLGQFDVITCLEVIEHCGRARVVAQRIREALKPGGLAIVTTPYHGYLKNVAIALSGQWDEHHQSLWDGGHAKFWSEGTITRLLDKAGMRVTRIHRVGRVPVFAKSMVVTAVSY